MTVQNDATTVSEPVTGVTLTDGAAIKVKALLEQEGRTDLALRIAVQPGGCSGLRYQLFFDDRAARRRRRPRLRRVQPRDRPNERALPRRRHDRLRRHHREAGLHDRQPERHGLVCVRRLLQLIGP